MNHYEVPTPRVHGQLLNWRQSFPPILTILFTESDFEVKSFAVSVEGLKMIPNDAVGACILLVIRRVRSYTGRYGF